MGFRCGVLIVSPLEFQFEDKNLKIFEVHKPVVKSSDAIYLLQPVCFIETDPPNVAGFS